MVYESRVGDVFALGATSWRIEDITHDRVLVTPAPGVPGRLPFWKGDALGRPAELGEAVGAFTRELAAMPKHLAEQRAMAEGLDAYAAGNLVGYLHEQLEATQVLPSDQTLLVERFRDELGDWRLVVHSPYGTPVHAPWALAINARLRERYGIDGQAVASDDGIVIRIPDTDAEAPGGEVVVFSPDEIDDLVTQEVGGSALFASRFRECAARALLLPRRDPGRRSPLWQQRQRSAALLEVASRYPSFPIVLEAVRECLQDVYDLPALVGLMRSVEQRKVQVTDVSTQSPSPFARSLLFGYVAQFVYEGDSPIAERRAAALSLDQGLLAELLGRAELRELLDPEVLAELEAELQRLTPERRARGAEGVADLLRLLGPLSTDEVAGAMRRRRRRRATRSLRSRSRVELVEVRVAGVERWAAVEDVGRLRDGLGVAVPPGTPDAFTDPVDDPLADLVSRYARTHGPFTTDDVARPARPRHRRGPADPPAAGRPGPGARRRVPAGCVRAGVVRRRGAAVAAAPEPGPAAQGGRAGPAGRPGPVPERLAARRRQAPRRRRRGLGHRPARRCPGAGQRPRAAGAGRPGPRLRAVLPRRAHRRRRGALGRTRLAARRRRLGLAPPRRPGAADPARARAVRAQRAPPGRPRRAGARVVRGSSASSPSRSARPTTRRSAPPCGTSSGPAGSATTPSRRSGRSPAPARPATAPSDRPPGPGWPRPPAAAAPRCAPGRPRPPAAGRCSPQLDTDPTRRAHAAAERLLDRHGVVIRGAVVSERQPGGFAAVYKVLSAFEDSGRCRRGYFVEGLGAAQFGTAGAIDRLRTFSEVDDGGKPTSVCLAATDPANPYGAALPWPQKTAEGDGGHRPGRKAGALVVMVDGELVLYVERGGRTLLTWSDDADRLGPATASLAEAARRGSLGRLTVERADGAALLGGGSTPLREALDAAGFVATPRGLRLRSSSSA